MLCSHPSTFHGIVTQLSWLRIIHPSHWGCNAEIQRGKSLSFCRVHGRLQAAISRQQWSSNPSAGRIQEILRRIGRNSQVQVYQVHQAKVSWTGRSSKWCRKASTCSRRRRANLWRRTCWDRYLRVPMYHLPREHLLRTYYFNAPGRRLLLLRLLVLPCLREVFVRFR